MSTGRNKTPDDAARDAANARIILEATLASIPEVPFLNAIWAARAIQSNRVPAGLAFLKEVPEEARSDKISDPLAIYPWELELLANERLSLSRGALFQYLDPMRWQQITALVNLIRNIEGDEYLANNEPETITDYIFKIGSRQFEWQQGFLTKQEIFRSTFVYGQGACADYFEDTYGVTVNNFTAVCFAYFSVLVEKPQVVRDLDLSLLGITKKAREATLQIISLHLRKIKLLAGRERAVCVETAFKPSVLRRFPLIGVTARSHHLCCPIPDLLINRMTFGLFYDVIPGGGKIRAEIGEQIEAYCHKIIKTFMEKFTCTREFSYMSKDGQKRSSDLLLYDAEGKLRILFECKATRLQLTTRYADFDKRERGYQEMVKGITQIWRFVADARLGETTATIEPNTLGAILTLDSWFVAAPNRQKNIIDEARQICARQYPNVEDCDQIPVAFVYMPEFERALAQGTEESIMQTFQDLAEADKQGFSFDLANRGEGASAQEFRDFPFESEISSILPWWGKIMELRNA